MDKIKIYGYYKENRKRIVQYLENKNCIFRCVSKDMQSITIKLEESNINGIYIDISNFFKDDYTANTYSPVIESIIDNLEEIYPIYLIIDHDYIENLDNLLYFKIDEVLQLEKELNIEIHSKEIKNIVDISQDEFMEIIDEIDCKLIGNDKFKRLFLQELKKYRIFNNINVLPIFSVLICGPSGVGKTELARIIHKKLSPNENLIKINFGNYSDKNSLSSLIGSPRGYVGSECGELSEKLQKSKSKVILIDEFEKSDSAIQNFFLQLLEDGSFTDSLGREFNLNKYIIIFTSNLTKVNVQQVIAKELLSRFSFIYVFSKLKTEQKIDYIEVKLKEIVEKIEGVYGIELSQDEIEYIKDIDVEKYNNMRDINKQIMNRTSEKIYDLVYE